MRITKLLAVTAVLCANAAYVNAADLNRQQVPTAVLNAFEKAYPNAQDIEYERETKDGKTYFEIEFEDKEGNEMEAVYNESGEVMSTKIDD